MSNANAYVLQNLIDLLNLDLLNLDLLNLDLLNLDF